MAKITLLLSADLYEGAPIAEISFDGRLIVEVSVHATHESGTHQTVTLDAPDPGGHLITVGYVNDVYEGSRDKDRNLFLDGALFDGVDLGIEPVVMCEPMQSAFLFNVPFPGQPPGGAE